MGFLPQGFALYIFDFITVIKIFIELFKPIAWLRGPSLVLKIHIDDMLTLIVQKIILEDP